MSGNLLFLSGNEVDALLTNENETILKVVEQVYLANHQGKSMLPESSFLRFPGKDRERIISLPAYLGAPFNCAGIKWISSFPDNVKNNMERASAIYVLNSLETGHPIAVMESSIISAKRTAAGAALSASLLIDDKSKVNSISMVGTGLINFETLKFLMHLFPAIKTIHIFDIDAGRASQFKQVILRFFPDVLIECTDKLDGIFEKSFITSFATTAITPYITSLGDIQEGSVILHTSLRDLAPEIMLAANNVVDDRHHACSANTSLHLASKIKDSDNFINCTMGELLTNGKSAYIKDNRPMIASPFGMGLLDLALAQLLYNKALDANTGTTINQFIPEPWFKKTA